MLDSFFKKRAIIKTLKTLPAILARDYGRSDFYTIGQVTTAFTTTSLNEKYLQYAVIIFTDPESVKIQFKEIFGKCNYDVSRSYLSEMFFCGSIDFTVNNSLYSSVGNSGHDSMGGGTQTD